MVRSSRFSGTSAIPRSTRASIPAAPSAAPSNRIAPRDVVAKLHVEVALILNQPDTRERLAADGMAVVASTPAQFTEFLARETNKYARIIQAAGITAAQ